MCQTILSVNYPRYVPKFFLWIILGMCQTILSVNYPRYVPNNSFCELSKVCAKILSVNYPTVGTYMPNNSWLKLRKSSDYCVLLTSRHWNRWLVKARVKALPWPLPLLLRFRQYDRPHKPLLPPPLSYHYVGGVAWYMCRGEAGFCR